MKWLRHRNASPRLSDEALAVTWQLVSVLLDYPDDQLIGRLPMLRQVAETLPEEPRDLLVTAIDRIASAPLRGLQTEYVDTFDVTRKCCLHLSYVTHGDTRRRGVALVEFKQAYRRAGANFDTDEELPDHLGVVLEFGAAYDLRAAWTMLTGYRVAIELLRAGLAQRTASPWLGVVDALRATLPQLDDDDAVALQRLIAQGPPQEDVGLEPYAIDPRLNPRPEPVDTTAMLGTSIPVGAPR